MQIHLWQFGTSVFVILIPSEIQNGCFYNLHLVYLLVLPNIDLEHIRFIVYPITVLAL